MKLFFCTLRLLLIMKIGFSALFVASIILTGCLSKTPTNERIRFYLLEDKAGNYAAEEVWQYFQQGKFIEQHTNSFNPGFTTSEYWLVVSSETSTIKDLQLRIGTSQINEIDFYVINKDTPELVSKTGDIYPFRSRPVSSLNFRFQINPENPYYLLRINKKNESLQLTFEVAPRHQFDEQLMESSVVFGIFTGVIVLMIVFGLFLFTINREPVYLFYSLYIACGWLYVLSNQGFGYKYFWPDSPWLAQRARPIFTMLTMAFSIHFLEAYAGKSKRWIQWTLYGLVGIAYGLLLINFLMFDLMESSRVGYYFQILLPALALIYIICLMTTLFQKIASGNRMALFYLASMLPIIVFTMIQVSYYSGAMDVSGSYLQVYGQATGYLLESLILTFGLAYRFNNYRLEKELLLIAVNQQQVKYTKAIISTQESERRKLADQLHDVAGSLLSAAKLNLSSIREKTLLPNDAQAQLASAEESVTHIADILRDMSHAISPVMLDKVGFRQSVEKITSIFNASGKITVELEMIGFESMNSNFREKYSVMYGILYELMNNIAKHAQAKHALIQLVEHENSFVMMVEDNGVGLAHTKKDTNDTQGLAAIRSKIHYLNGTIAFDQALPTGLIVTIEIPKENDETSRIGG